jgi:hypothetical protein
MRGGGVAMWSRVRYGGGVAMWSRVGCGWSSWGCGPGCDAVGPKHSRHDPCVNTIHGHECFGLTTLPVHGVVSAAHHVARPRGCVGRPPRCPSTGLCRPPTTLPVHSVPSPAHHVARPRRSIARPSRCPSTAFHRPPITLPVHHHGDVRWHRSSRRPRRTPTRRRGWQGIALKRDHALAAAGIASRQRKKRHRTCQPRFNRALARGRRSGRRHPRCRPRGARARRALRAASRPRWHGSWPPAARSGFRRRPGFRPG